MRCRTYTYLIVINICVLSITVDSALLRDVIAPSQSARVPRDNKFYSNRYGAASSTSVTHQPAKPNDELEAREATQNPVEKRCARCDPNDRYDNPRYPYESGAGRGRYDDRRNRDRDYDRYDERRYPEDRDRYDDRYYNRRPSYERERDRYDRDRYDRGYERDRYDGRDRYYDRDYERGFGYDNRGYDYRDKGYGYEDREGSYGGRGGGYGKPDGWSPSGGGGYASSWNYGRDEYRDREKYDYDGFMPLDETYRGVSGFDSKGRGFYFASGIPAGDWGGDSWVDFSDRYAGGSGGGGGVGGGVGGGHRPRDPYPYDGYRTSYLYGRPSSTTTKTSVDGEAQTQNPQDGSG